MNKCNLCRERGKTWSGSNPVCAWESDEFSNNWNCATLNAIRDLEGHEDADYRFCDDQKYMTIKIDGVDLRDGSPLALWVTWYKQRGRTDEMFLLWGGRPPSQPSEDDLVRILGLLGRHP